MDKSTFHRSSFCGGAGCVEAALSGGMILLRDSKDASGPVLRFTIGEWATFLAGVHLGEFSTAALELRAIDALRVRQVNA